MDPLTLLIKPMIAAGLFVTKMLVAVGYVATDPKDPAVQQQQMMEHVRVAVVPSASGIESMELEMPNGELFQLRDTRADSERSARRSPGRPTTSQRVARAEIIATLESTFGRTMRCDVAMPDDSKAGSAHCTVERGESYDVAF